MFTLLSACLLALSTLITAVLLLRLTSSLRAFSPEVDTVIPDDAPSVSVCIPARNEVHAMTLCLERVLKSDYKKLEVLVFDDGSSDNTSIIIRSFAQAGVRFVAGTKVPEGWLGKNYALDVLAREASGTHVIFMDVDTAISPSTISQLVGYLQKEHVSMLSVIPQRADGWRLSVLFGHLRYFWELSMKSNKRYAAASALWMIDRHLLIKKLGGLAPIRSTTAPESSIALTLGNAKYRCLVSGRNLGVTYEKKWSSQVEGSRRLLYSKAGGRPVTALGSFVMMLLLNVPTFLLLSGFFYGWSGVQLSSSLVLGFGMLMYGMYTSRLWQQAWWAGFLVWPVVMLQELILFVASCIGYWRHTITWKGRPVTPTILSSAGKT